MGTAFSLAHPDSGSMVSWPSRVLRISLLLPLTLLAGLRPMVSNLTHVDKNVLSVVLVAGFTIFSVRAFHFRLQSRRSDFIPVDIFIFLQFVIALTASLIYIVSGVSQSSDAVYGIYCYALAPLLLYTGFVFARTTREWKRALYWACLLTYAVMLAAGICEVLGIQFWLFENERFLTQRNFLNIGRASGLYGTQIDFGCLSFICLAFAYFAFLQSKRKVHLIFTFLAIAGVVLSMSRVWFLATTLVIATPVLRPKSVKQFFGVAVLMCVLGAVLVPAMDALGFIDSILSRDEVSQQSNDDRLTYLKKSPQWLLDDYVIVGSGPGTQTGPDPGGKKFIGDFMWLGILIDYGTAVGGAIVGLRIIELMLVTWRSLRQKTRNVAHALAITLCGAQFFASFVDSTFAHLVTLSIFYMICGVALYTNDRIGTAAR